MGLDCLRKTAALLAALSVATAACAQYIWLDEKGVRQYSDMPPGTSVPPNRILKAPAARTLPQAAPAPIGNKNENSEKARGAENPGMTTAEKNADFQKRRMEKAEKEKKAAEEEKRAADKAANCERARSYIRSLTSGARNFTINERGGRTYMTDEQRLKEVEQTKSTLEGCPAAANGGAGTSGY